MHVSIGSHDFRLSQSLRSLLSQRLAWALRHCGRQVRQVEAWIDQAGEADKRCHIEIQLLPSQRLAFDAVAADAGSAVDVAIRDVECAMGRLRTAPPSTNRIAGLIELRR